ncbi:MAG: hypothetical protein MUC65_09925 [Pontiellaceae bacterium]|nr:hypothetical protein [Pontiellaceae bacterium]
MKFGLVFPILGIVFLSLSLFSEEPANGWKSAEALFQTLEKNFSTIKTRLHLPKKRS